MRVTCMTASCFACRELASESIVHVMYAIESCHTYEWGTSYVWMSHVTQICLARTGRRSRSRRCVWRHRRAWCRGALWCMTWLNHVCDVTHLDSFMCVKWFICVKLYIIYDMPDSFVWCRRAWWCMSTRLVMYDSFMCLTCLIWVKLCIKYDMPHSFAWNYI